MGHKLRVRKLLAGRFGETLYKVERFRAFYKGRGMTGEGLVQFYGPRASRSYRAGDKAPDWEVDEVERMHTVDLGEATIS